MIIKNYLNHTTTEKHFNDFLNNGKQPCMMHSNPSGKKAPNSDNLWIKLGINPSRIVWIEGKCECHQTCGKLRSDPFSLENALSQKTRISLFSELLVRSVPDKLSADLSHRFFEKQNITTWTHSRKTVQNIRPAKSCARFWVAENSKGRIVIFYIYDSTVEGSKGP
jgi:hypothetical protein